MNRIFRAVHFERILNPKMNYNDSNTKDLKWENKLNQIVK
jgi:hypothetical protein